MKSSSTEVRPASPADVPVLLPLVAAYWEFEGLAGFDARRVAPPLERLLSDSRMGAGWVALSKGEPVGYLLAVYVFSLEHFGLTAEIDEFFVTPAARAAGVGSALLLAAEADARHAGCTNISLQLGRGNDAARHFYSRHGYGARAGYELLDKGLKP